MLRVFCPAALSVWWLVAQATAPAVAPAVEIVLVNGDQRSPMTSQAPEPRSHNFRLAVLVFSKDVLTVGGTKSTLRVKNRTPAFQLSLRPGVDPQEAVALVRLKPKDGRREAGHDHETANKLHDGELLPLSVAPADPAGAAETSRTYRVTPKSPLKTGEYALVVQGRFYDFAVE